MVNMYYTREPLYKVKAFLQNQTNFYILDIHKIIRDLGFKLPLRNKGEEYFINQQILELIKSKLNYKKLYGIIYINKRLSRAILGNMKSQTENMENMGKHVLLDNAFLPKLEDMYGCADEVVFYENFKKLKIFEVGEVQDIMRQEQD